MVTQVVTGLVLVGLAGFAVAKPIPGVTLTSEIGMVNFGEILRADGDLLVVADGSKDEHRPLARIIRVKQGRLVEESRLLFRDGISGIGVSAGRVAIKLDTQRVAIYERGTAWTLVDTVTLEGGCRYTGDRGVELARDVLVIRGEEAVCVYEKRARWKLTTTRPFTNAGNHHPVINGDRIAQRNFGARDGVRLSRRRGDTWATEQDVPVGPDRQLQEIAISERWLAVATSSRNFDDYRVELYALGSEVRHVVTLPSSQEIVDLAISNERLVVRGASDHQLYELRGSWRSVGLVPGVAGHFSRVAVGDVWWISRFGGRANHPGVVDGYAD